MTDAQIVEAIKLHDEIMLLSDIINYSANQPEVTFSFQSGTSKSIMDEDLTYEILHLIKDFKVKLEHEFAAL